MTGGGLKLRMMVVAAAALLLGGPAAADNCGPPPADDATLIRAPAVSAAIAAADAEFEHARGRLYRIETEPPSYVFGTFHLPGGGIEEPGPLVSGLVAQSRMVFVEVDEAGLQTALGNFVLNPGALMRTDGRLLSDVMSAEDLAAARALFDAYGLPFHIANRLRPGVLAIMMSVPLCAQNTWPPKPGLDVRIERIARENGIPVKALETAEEQFQALLGDDDADGDRLLRAMLPMAESTAESLHTYRALYRTRHVGAVWSLSVASVEDALGAEEARLLLDRIWDALLRKRNAKMLTTMLPALRQGGVFAAVGALHLVGEDGLISLLEEADFTLAPVPGG